MNPVSEEHETERARGPLTGLRVVELGQLIAGPFCGQLLGDYGADVIKVEEPTNGDPMRRWGYAEEDHGPVHWSVLGRNKRSFACDLRKPEGQELVRKLIGTADIVVENFRPGTMERWGLDYESLSADNPGLIMVRVTGFGQDGPYSSRPGYGSIGEAMGGLRHLLGEPDRPPSRAGVSIGDSLAGTLAALGVVAAVVERSSSGRGQVIDCALYEAVLSMMESLVSDFATFGHVRERTGAVLPGVAPSNVYPTEDGADVLIAANQDTVFRRLCAAMGREDLVEDRRFATHQARGKRQDELDKLISDWSASLSLSALQQRLEEHAVPMGLIYRAPEMLDDPHFRARESIVEVPTDGRPLPMQGVFPRFSRTPGAIRWSGPLLGASTADVLDELGIDTDERSELRQRGVIT
ncbi:CaiB/BaiF CoA transferase family protein [Nocardioides marmotae]|uniref:CaiB/BaiF CoA transferase family protein n=1 Tax=Nocardioides marmotae TaxID=2663857 RepID=UPI0012B5B405|nr:CaiB/BaiF CoA-transferase family protein [Nocardioides marmotae]MBC9734762.1 CoA transferase [Nocardioides marmotae]MTB85863.1 CoA transferase [Nocardioides marmotae]